ncbi:30S ribosomal protein S20 [Fructilactobacillus lindneri]|uniref:Small ribosomal subunit protein bS20 n=1 Tax=Fructilactobacillus lindneri TaxID=53444 RepID=A0AB33BRX3_9LACO|nr:30S ribosomal protein S20 [Fructilactobacillus lindneri]ANZ58042.1 30S ribosomal protein S20 [Fructilactobacillus lindneri]ANZ59363.1 30S ribosomal protein S20 [Fructilactobacillus lindneri]POG98853.1 30S ribosomal protein S20 [Fructilactobacillus lindneri]POH03126.1 30S ribosomal protein S20 [Fructilactobacillus lindneri]POH04241.1 30S ribosomal protein S20 [Fructilactobacillus lindneri]
MPVIKSAIERMKTNEIVRKRNASEKNEMRSAIKRFEKASADGAKDVEKIYRDAIAAIDHSKSKGLIKTNSANRKKSHLAKIKNTL